MVRGWEPRKTLTFSVYWFCWGDFMARLLGMTALAVLMGAGGAHAEDAPTKLGPIVVTATRSERPVSSTPGGVVIIEREDIVRQLQLSKDPADMLQRYVPGFSASNQSVSGAGETFRGRSLQVLVDGVSRNTPLRDVSRLISLIDLNQVERIEVVNGASGIYGNGATGGVINFITKRGEGGGTQTNVAVGFRAFTADIGSSLAPELSVNTSGMVGAVDYFVSATGEQTRDTFDGQGRRLPDDPLLGQGAFSDSDKLNLNGTVGYSFGDERVELSGEFIRFEQEPEFYTLPTTPVSVNFAQPYTGRPVEDESYYFQARYLNRKFALGHLDVQAFYSGTEKRFADALLSVENPLVYYSGNPLSPQSSDGQTSLTAEQIGLKVAVDSDLKDVVPGLSLTWGADVSRDETEQHFQDGVAAIAPMSQDSYAVFLQADQRLTDWLLVRGGVRYERFELDISDFTRPSYSFRGLAVVAPTQVRGGDFSYSEAVFNLGAVAFLTDEVELYGGFSQGFSIPDVGAFTRRAGANTFPAVPAAIDFSSLGIEASVVDNYELGLRGEWMNVRGNVSGFVSTSDLGTNFDVTLNRVQQQKERVYGVEFTGEWDATDELTLGALARWTEGKRDTNGDGSLDAYLPNNRIAPPVRLTGYADWKVTDALSTNVEAVYLGERDEHDGTTRVKIASAFLVNLGADYAIDASNSVTIGVRNVFDRDYLNPAASANRNFQVSGFGRQVSLRFATRF